MAHIALRPFAFAAVLLAASTAAAQAPVSPTTLVRTTHTSLWSPASPDPSCVTFRPETGDFWTTDNEVDEMSIFGGVTLWRHDNFGNVSETFDLTGFTNEPSGIAFDPAGGRAWISDDNSRVIHRVGFGPDGQAFTADDVIGDIDGLFAAGCNDPEDVTYNPFDGRLYIPSVDSVELCVIDPGPNGDFDDAAPIGDDVVTTIDLAPQGVLKPKGITHDPLTNTLIIGDRGVNTPNRDLWQATLAGVVLRKIDGTVPGGYKPSGVTFGPSTVNPMLRALFVTDNATDNLLDPLENDGKIHEFVVLPLGGNAAPVVDAGSAQSIEWPDNQVTLSGAVTDDGHPYPPSALTWSWVAQSGPGTVTFSDAEELDTTATFSAPGVYVLRLEGDDFALTGSDTVEITVTPALHALAVTVIGPGTVAIDPPAGPYADGAIVTLTALPNSNGKFFGWSGDLSGSVTPTSIAMTADRAVQAEFRATSVPACGIGPELALLVPVLAAFRSRRGRASRA
jgi:hypothetical protein